MSQTIKKSLYSFLSSIFLIFCLSGAFETVFSKLIVSVGIPIITFLYFTILYASDGEKNNIFIFIKNNLSKICKYIFGFIFLIFLSETYQTPNNEFILNTQENFTIMFMLVLTFHILKAPIEIILNKSSNPSSVLYEGLIECSFLYFLCIWLLGHIGDDLFNYYVNNEVDSISLFIAFLLSVFLFKSILINSGEENRQVINECKPHAQMKVPETLTKKDKEYTATHEAGHALLYACLNKIPDDFKIVVNSESTDVMGFVSFFGGETIVEEKNYAEWLMLVYLAGNFAEEFRYGECTLGGGSDHSRWCDIAQKYLKNGFRGVYYPFPSNSFEHKENQLKIEELKNSQLSILKDFFTINKEVFIEFSDFVLKREKVSKKDALIYFERIKLSEKMPKLKKEDKKK